MIEPRKLEKEKWLCSEQPCDQYDELEKSSKLRDLQESYNVKTYKLQKHLDLFPINQMTCHWYDKCWKGKGKQLYGSTDNAIDSQRGEYAKFQEETSELYVGLYGQNEKQRYLELVEMREYRLWEYMAWS